MKKYKHIRSFIYAEVNKDGKWEKVGNVFKSSLKEMEGMLTDRVCDENNEFLICALAPEFYNVILGERFSKICPFKSQDINFYDLSEEMQSRISAIDKVSADTKRFVYYIGSFLDEDIWNQEISEIKYLSFKQYRKYLKDGHFPSFTHYKKYSDVVSEEDAEYFVNSGIDIDEKSVYVEVKVNKKKLKDLCGFFYNESLKTLKALEPEGRANAVRIVCMFKVY